MLYGNCSRQTLDFPSIPQNCHVDCKFRTPLMIGWRCAYCVCAPSDAYAKEHNQQTSVRKRFKICNRLSQHPSAEFYRLCVNVAARTQVMIFLFGSPCVAAGCRLQRRLVWHVATRCFSSERCVLYTNTAEVYVMPDAQHFSPGSHDG